MASRSAELLSVDESRITEALRHGHAQKRRFENVTYIRFLDDRPDIPRGTVVVDGRVVPPYPRIGRIFALASGVRENFDGPFQVEEKLDGYNVRVVRSGGRLVAFTRGGFACPFTTDRLPDLGRFEPLFDEEPDLVLCGEVAGPENPYLHGRVPYVEEDVAFFAFDLMRLGRREFLPLDERDALLASHEIRATPTLGRYSPEQPDALRELVLRLDRQGSEGMILKPLGRGSRVKYVTPSINVYDIVEDASLLAELPGEFFSSRIVRLAISLEELGLRHRAHDLAETLGKALLEDFEAALREFQRTGVISQVFQVRMREPLHVAMLLGHLKAASKRVNVKELSREHDGRHFRVRFRKIYQQSTGWLGTVLRGKSIVD